MKKKIIITGGLGYIGTELCRLYSGLSWHHKIFVIDNRFISERVNQIRNWNMEFIHGDILDKDLVNKYFNTDEAFIDPPPIPDFWGIFFFTFIKYFLLFSFFFKSKMFSNFEIVLFFWIPFENLPKNIIL